MRPAILLLCVSLAACSSVTEGVPARDDVPQPDPAMILRGLKAAAADSRFAQPIELTNPIRANPNSSSPWMICLRSAQSEQTKRVTYSAFFNDAYVSSRYSVTIDACASQRYHAFNAN